MKRSVKFLFTLLSLIILFNSSTAYAKVFKDTKNHWAKVYIDDMSDRGFMTGYAQDTFKPDDMMSRAEFYSIINSMAGLEKTYAVTFSDVSTSDWYYQDIAKAIKAGYLTPTTGALNPNKPISRQEVMGIIGYIYKVKPDSAAASKFADSASIRNENKGYVGALVKVGVVNGGAGGMLYPNNPMSRAEVAKVLFTMVDKYELPSERVVVDSKIKFGDRNLYN